MKQMKLTDKRYILFDLDGTLTDPLIGITKSVQYSLRNFGIDIEDNRDLVNFIGPPLRQSYMKYYGFDEDLAERAVKKYREYFSETGIFENEVYDGIEAMLKKLRGNGKTLILATSKPYVFAEKILEHFGIAEYFSFVSGSELNGERSLKSEVIRYAMDNIGILSLDEAVMIGDREHDIIGAKALGMDSVGVLYGYGDLQELTDAGADFIAGCVDELDKILTGEN